MGGIECVVRVGGGGWYIIYYVGIGLGWVGLGILLKRWMCARGIKVGGVCILLWWVVLEVT